MHYYVQPGFSSDNKLRRTFVPSDEQIDIAARRILGFFEKNDGAIYAVNERDMLNILERGVHNRDRQLGDQKKGHFRKVLALAWRKLCQLNKIVFDIERYQYALNYRFDKKRPRRQRYPAGQLTASR